MTAIAMPASIARESRQLVPVPITGDFMEPTFRRHRDIALVAPGNQYCGEGFYAVYPDVGPAKIYRVSGSSKRGHLHLTGDNPLYWGGDRSAPRGDHWPRETFLHNLMGEVRGVISIFSPSDWRDYVDMIEGGAAHAR